MSRFNYSTQGYTLVGCVIQGAAGESYADYMRRRVFDPAGMSHTVVDDRYAIVPLRTRFYHHDSAGHVVNADLLDNSYKLPGGGWLSSADDLAHFEIALLHDVLLRPTTRAMAWTTQHTSSGAATGYGLGWGVDSAAGAHDVGHSGGQQGTSTAIIIDPVADRAVVVLTNMDNVDAFQLAKEVLRLIGGPSQAAQR
jgi:CubicO group peptidase (beta-lactamase class C family)